MLKWTTVSISLKEIFDSLINYFLTYLPEQSIEGLSPLKKQNKIKSKSKVRVEENIKNKSCSIRWVDPKTVCEPFPHFQKSSFGPQKGQNNPRDKSKTKVIIEGGTENKNISAFVDQKSELKET